LGAFVVPKLPAGELILATGSLVFSLSRRVAYIAFCWRSCIELLIFARSLPSPMTDFVRYPFSFASSVVRLPFYGLRLRLWFCSKLFCQVLIVFSWRHSLLFPFSRTVSDAGGAHGHPNLEGRGVILRVCAGAWFLVDGFAPNLTSRRRRPSTALSWAARFFPLPALLDLPRLARCPLVRR